MCLRSSLAPGILNMRWQGISGRLEGGIAGVDITHGFESQSYKLKYFLNHAASSKFKVGLEIDLNNKILNICISPEHCLR